jgi:hypothetical protein
MRWLLLLAVFLPTDLDVDVPAGSPLDGVKVPTETPRKGPVATPTKREPARPGETVVEEPSKPEPGRPVSLPRKLPGITTVATPDYAGHLRWTPDPKSTEERPARAAEATGGGGGLKKPGSDPAEPPAAPWDMSCYPPRLSRALYEYVIARFLMVLLHPSQVGSAEMLEFLIETGDAAYVAATACRADLPDFAKEVIAAVEGLPARPPEKPAAALEQMVVMDLVACSPYEPEFAGRILAKPAETTLPVLLSLIRKEPHPLVVRNAVFLLRCYDDPAVLPVLREQMKGSDRVCRNRAVVALARWKDEASVEWLCAQLAGRDRTFRSMAAWALGRIGSAAALEPLIAAAKTDETDLLWAAVPALGRVADALAPAARKTLVEALKAIEKRARSAKDEAVPKELVVMQPDPGGIQGEILVQRVRIAQARAGVESAMQWMKDQGPQKPEPPKAPGGGVIRNSARVHRANVDFFNETLGWSDSLKKKP